MSLVGIHVECGIAQNRGTSTLFEVLWSETVAYGTATTQKAPSGLASPGNLTFRIRNSAQGEAAVARGAANSVDPTSVKGVASEWALAVGAAPNGSASAIFEANELRDLPAKPGEVVKAVLI